MSCQLGFFSHRAGSSPLRYSLAKAASLHKAKGKFDRLSHSAAARFARKSTWTRRAHGQLRSAISLCQFCVLIAPHPFAPDPHRFVTLQSGMSCKKTLFSQPVLSHTPGACPFYQSNQSYVYRHGSVTACNLPLMMIKTAIYKHCMQQAWHVSPAGNSSPDCRNNSRL